MVYQKIQRDLELNESIVNAEPSSQFSAMRVFRALVATCMLSLAKAGYYLSFDKTQRPEHVFSNKRHIVMYAIRCLTAMGLVAYLSNMVLGGHHHVFDVQRIGILFDYIVP